MRKSVVSALLCAVLLLLAVMPSALAGDSDTVSVPDAAFKSFLNGKLGHAAAADITEADMKRITKIELPRTVADLEGIQYCTNLTWFRTYGTPKNLQLLGNCTKLEFLAIMNSMLDDISFVSGLTQVNYLNLYQDEIQDISPLRNLTKLKVLDLMGNHVIDMSPLENIHSQMTHLYGLSESRTLTLDCMREENGFCIIENPVVGIDAKPVAPKSASNCEYDAASNTFRVPAGTVRFSFKTSQPTIPNSTDFQNNFNTSVTVNINHPPKTGSLTVSKVLQGNSTDPGQPFAFRVSLNNSTVNGSFSGVSFTNGTAEISLKGGESLTVSGLPDQITYTVTEIDPGDYTCSAPDGISGTIDYLVPAAAEFTNTRNEYFHVSYCVEPDSTFGEPGDSVAPVDSGSYAPNAPVTVADALQSRQNYGVDRVSGARVSGTWSFSGWDKTDFPIQKDTVITGIWNFTPDHEGSPVPKTGDHTRPALLGVLLAASASVLMYAVIRAKKKED